MMINIHFFFLFVDGKREFIQRPTLWARTSMIQVGGSLVQIWLSLILAKFAILSATRLQHLRTYWALKKLKLEAIPKASINITPLWDRLSELCSKLSITNVPSLSKIGALIPKFWAKTNPSFMVITSALRASNSPQNFFVVAAMNLPCQSLITAPTLYVFSSTKVTPSMFSFRTSCNSTINIHFLGLVWYCSGFLRAAEFSELSKNCSKKVIIVPFGKIM